MTLSELRHVVASDPDLRDDMRAALLAALEYIVRLETAVREVDRIRAYHRFTAALRPIKLGGLGRGEP